MQSLYTPETQTIPGQFPLNTVQFEPEYKKKSRGLLMGGQLGELSLATKGWFGISKSVIENGEYPILAASWRSEYIVWVTRVAAKFYSQKTSSNFGELEMLGITDCKPSISWISNDSLFIGYGDAVNLIAIKERSVKDIAAGLPQKYIESTMKIKLEFICCGLAPFKDMILVLGMPKSGTDEDKPEPQIYIINKLGEVDSNDHLSLSIPPEMTIHAVDFQLGYQVSENLSDTTYYIISPYNIIIAKPRDVKDHVAYLLNMKEYEKAIEAVESSQDCYSKRERKSAIAEIGMKLLDKLLENGNFEKGSALCPRVFKQNKEHWETAFYKFDQYRKIHTLFTVLPFETPVLTSNVYDLALLEFLEQDLELLEQAITKWPFGIYSPKAIIQSIEKALKNASETNLIKLQSSLVHLYL